jgi:hypothetical protein
MGDLNGDGKPDISLVGVSGYFSVYQNVSTPGSITNTSLASRVDYGTRSNPHGVAIGDLDGDGRPDVVFANQNDNVISVYKNAMPFGGAPVIISQPTNQMTTVGGAVTFNVTASGTSPLSYQWSFNTTNIVGATNSLLVLTNVQLSQAGNYAVLVTNLYGSVLSSNAILTVNLPLPCTPAPSGLVSWWPAEGNANDIVGTNNGALVNGATYESGMVGQGFSFNGVNSYVQIADSPSLDLTNEFTIELWYKDTGTTGTYFGLVNKRPLTVGACNFGIQIMTGNPGGLRVLFEESTSGTFQISSYSPAPAVGVFHHVAATYRQSTATQVEVKTFIDGQLVKTATLSGNLANTVNHEPVTIGCDNPVGGDFIKGIIDEVSIYNRALSTNEIAAIYDAGSGGKCPPITPSITTQPTNQTVVVGGTASFSVTASGTSPLSYQWSFNTTNIVGATNSLLVLTNVQLSQAGNYAVLVTNLYGSILSSNVVLTVTLDHFAWGSIPSPRFVNTPFSVVIRAQDMTNGLFTNFTSTAILGTTNGIAITPPVSGNFIQGVWTGSVVVSQTASNLVLQANDGLGHFGLANPINVIDLPILGMLRSGNIALYAWPVGYSGFVLETSDSLSPAKWAVVPYAPIQLGDEYLLPLDMTGTNGFYRLQLSDP